MTASSLPDFLTVYVDPGEDTGWCVGRGSLLLGAGTTKLWHFGDDVWAALSIQSGLMVQNGPGPASYSELLDPEAAWVLEGRAEHVGLPIKQLVVEDWRLYPWKLKSLGWDQCRTARLIGSITQASRFFGIPLELQPASIKEQAVAAGAEELFFRPLHENRHQNDALMHFIWYTTNNASDDLLRQQLREKGLDSVAVPDSL